MFKKSISRYVSILESRDLFKNIKNSYFFKNIIKYFNVFLNFVYNTNLFRKYRVYFIIIKQLVNKLINLNLYILLYFIRFYKIYFELKKYFSLYVRGSVFFIGFYKFKKCLPIIKKKSFFFEPYYFFLNYFYIPNLYNRYGKIVSMLRIGLLSNNNILKFSDFFNTGDSLKKGFFYIREISKTYTRVKGLKKNYLDTKFFKNNFFINVSEKGYSSFFFLRNNVIYLKSKYSKVRAFCRNIFYFTMTLNIIVINELHSIYYNIVINYGYLIHLIYLYLILFSLKVFLK